MGFIAIVKKDEESKDPIIGKWSICATFGLNTSFTSCIDSSQVAWEVEMYLKSGAEKIEITEVKS